MNAGVIILRTSRPDVSSSRVPMLLGVFSLCILLTSLSLKSSYGKGLFFFVPLLLLGGAVACTVALMSVPKARPPNSFKCPWVPVVPLCGIACNVYMMGSLDFSDWVHIGEWLLVGVAIYFGYGIWNSALREKNMHSVLLGSDVVGGGGGYNYGASSGEKGEEPLIGVGEEGSSSWYSSKDGKKNANKNNGMFSF